MKYYKLHLIRHGLTAGNLQGLYIGSGSDLPLCDEGRAQLKTLKKDFDYPVVPLVFTSPMKRATETAEILFPGVRQIELDDLREMAFGKFEGRAVQELVKDPEFAQWMDPTSRTVPAGAEDRQMFFNRTSSTAPPRPPASAPRSPAIPSPPALSAGTGERSPPAALWTALPVQRIPATARSTPSTQPSTATTMRSRGCSNDERKTEQVEGFYRGHHP